MRFLKVVHRVVGSLGSSGAGAAAGRVLAVALIALVSIEAVQRAAPGPGDRLFGSDRSSARPADRSAWGASCGSMATCAAREDRLLPDNREIAITIALDRPSPRVGETVLITVLAWDPDDAACCAVDVEVDRAVRTWPGSCREGSGAGVGARGSVTAQTTFKVPSAGRYVVNVRARSLRCGSTYASEHSAWTGFNATPASD